MNEDSIILRLIGKLPLGNMPNDEYVTIAELKTMEVNERRQTIDINTALISEKLVGKIKASHVNPFVNRSGVNYDRNHTYNPSFWIYLSKTAGLKKAEPLVVSWCSGNHTTYHIDQRFLSTFQLSPRLLKEEIVWDDLKGPDYAVIKNKPLSEYNFGVSTEAYVKLKKNYLKDYLYLRNKVAVQVFTIKSKILINEDIAFLLNGKYFFKKDLKHFEIRIHKYDLKENEAGLEISGYKILFQEERKDENTEELPKGHYWKGIDGLVTSWRARHELPFEYIYISDAVLVKYEADEDYNIYPDHGSVSYKNQWSVSHCERAGKNAIKIELKKLYEGARYEVIDYWNQFSIHPSEIIDGESIALKAKRLTKKFIHFGNLLANLCNRIWSLPYTAPEIITLDEKHIEHTGWSKFYDYKQITHYINLTSFSRDQFVSRCKRMYILLAENLKVTTLRKIVNHLGFPLAETEKLQSLKLLDLILKFLQVVTNTGLNPETQKETIVIHVKELREFKLLSSLIALTILRQLDAHKGGADFKSKIKTGLEGLRIDPNSIANNYADACFQMYDSLDEMFIEINDLLASSYG